jgi:hypothetical protein
MLKTKFFILLIFVIQAKTQEMDVYQNKFYLHQGDTLPYRIMYRLISTKAKNIHYCCFFMMPVNGAGITKNSLFMAQASLRTLRTGRISPP